MKRLDRWISLVLVLTLGFLLGMLGFSLWDKMPPTTERVAWSPEAQWIAPAEPAYRFYVRRTFYVADTVQGAWLRLSADDDFILYVNGRAIAKERNVLYNSLGLASRLSEPFQRLNDSVAYRSRGYDWIQLSNAKDWKLTTYIDLTSYLQPGKNTIAVETQKSRKNPRVVVEGAVYPLSKSPPINLTTGATPWLVSTLNEAHQGKPWFDLDFPDQSWPEAKAIGSVREATYSRVSQNLFDRLLRGNWITGTETSQGEVWLRSYWQVPKTRLSRAFIRLAGDGDYALLLNGLLVKRFGVDDSNQSHKLHMYEVTNFLQTGLNTLTVRLSRPLDQRSNQSSPLGFFLDGWVETAQNSITAPIATDSTWSALNQPIFDSSYSVDQGQPATILSPPDQQNFRRLFEGNAYLLNYPNYLWHQSFWQLAGIGFTSVCAWGLGRFWLDRHRDWWDSFGAGAGLLLPGTLFLVGINLLKHRYAEAERGLLFVQSQSNSLVLLGFVAVVLLTLLWSQMGWRTQDKHSSGLEKTLPGWGLWFLLGLIAFVSFGMAGGMAVSWSPKIFLAFLGFVPFGVLTLLWSRIRWNLKYWYTAILQAWPSWGQWFLLVLIVAIGFSLRTYNLGFVGLDADENTSYDATKGILRTGVPEAASGIWYTRSPAYHYMLALWLRILGDSIVNARFLSALWGTATLILVFIFTREITGKVWLALVVTAILAVDPSQVYFSRFIRFYQVVQFMSLLAFWSFFKGFIERKGRGYQYGFFFALTLMVLNQEVTITLLPCFLIGFLFFYRPFRLSVDWPIVLSSLVSLGIIAYDIVFFSIKCLTPWVALSDSTDAYLKLHLFTISGLANNFFVGPSRMHIVYSSFFFLGFVYFVRQRNGKVVFLFSSVVLNLILLTILIYQIATRYAYQIYPLFILLAVYSAVCLTESLGRRLESILKGLLPLRNVALVCIALLLLSNIEPGRVLASYQDALTRRNNEAFEYIRDHRQAGDVVVSTSPAGAATSLGGLDYVLPGTLHFDIFYWHEGRVIDRWGGGVVISNLDQMSDVLEKSKRVWLHIDNHTEGRFDPVSRQYIETLGQPVMETFGARVRLWRREDGLIPRVPYQGGDLGAY